MVPAVLLFDLERDDVAHGEQLPSGKLTSLVANLSSPRQSSKNPAYSSTHYIPLYHVVFGLSLYIYYII